MSQTINRIIICLILLIAATALPLFAQDFSSTNFTVANPVLQPGGYSTSTNFGLSSVLTQLAIGTSTTSTTFQLFGGFLYFPFITSPVVSATAGAVQVALSWTAASPGFGWAVSGYQVGQSSVSGGPYTFSSVGNVLSNTVTGLTGGTTYYFVIRVLDAFDNHIATSSEVSATPTSASSGGGGGGGGGGGSSGGYSGGTGGVNFSGRAYPASTVTLLKDAQIVATTIAGPDAAFQMSLANLVPGIYIFSIYGEDNQGNRSSLLTFPVSITAGATTNIGGVFLAPTIAVDKSQVKKGDTIVIFGQSVASSSVTIQVNSEPIFVQTSADNGGVYLYNFDTTPLEYGDHSTKSKAASKGEISPFSAAVPFKVGTQNVQYEPPKDCTIRGDLNDDCKVNLVDFSIMAYWYKRPTPPAKVDLSSDKKIDLIDFSILAYNWTG